MTPLNGYWYPRIELVWLKRIDFYPSRPSLEGLKEICIGTKCRNIGDALMNSTLPRLLRAAYPELKITTYPRGFNPVIFHHNPFVSGVSYLPDAVYGDDCNAGGGHIIQKKERYFGLPLSQPPRPEITLSASERTWASGFISRNTERMRAELPLCILHPQGHTYDNVGSGEIWNELIRNFRNRVRFWQVGIPGQGNLEGCDYYLMNSRSVWAARQLFAVIEQADALVGVNSAPMHIAQAFGQRSLILVDQKVPGDHEGMDGFLYPGNSHVDLKKAKVTEIQERVAEYLEGI